MRRPNPGIPRHIIDHPLVAAIMAAFPGSEISMASPPKPTAPEFPEYFEKPAIDAASEPAGVYIETLGKTDMATWTEDEWFRFLEIIILAARAKMSPSFISDEIPY